MSAFVRRFDFKPSDGGEILAGCSVLSIVAHVAQHYGMTPFEVERVLWLEVGGICRIKDVGAFRRVR